jgi:diamine N-acetyltransferase
MIYGDRVRLRAIERADLPSCVAWLNDPEVIEGLSLYGPISQVAEEGWFENMLKTPPDEHPLAVEIHKDDTWIYVGNCGFHKVDWRNRSSEIGIFIGEKSYWDQGFGTEVMRLMLCYGFDTLNLNRIFLRVFASNPRAIRSYEKADFIHEGRMREAEFRNGQYVDVLLMSVIRSEWKE